MSIRGGKKSPEIICEAHLPAICGEAAIRFTQHMASPAAFAAGDAIREKRQPQDGGCNAIKP